MKAIRNLLLFIGFGLLLISWFGWYSGFFTGVSIEVRELGPIYAVYEDHVGEYSETGQIKEKLFGNLWDDGIDNYKDFGIYYDDPGNTKTEEMRCKVGCVIEQNQVAELDQVMDKYNLFILDRQKVALIECPYINLFSLYVGIYKSYPKLRQYAAANNYLDTPIIEILDESKNIQFILPLVERD